MQELALMYNWCKKLKETFEEITQSYEQYGKNKGIVTYKTIKTTKNAISSKKQKKQIAKQRQQSESSQNELKPKSLNLSSLFPPAPIKSNKQSFEYKHRIAAFRKLSQKAEQDIETNQEETKVAEVKRKNSAFFLFAREKRTSIKQEYPELGNKEVSKILAQVWKNMSDSQKNAYENQNKNNRTDFERKFKKYLQGIIKLQNKRSRQAHDDQNE